MQRAMREALDLPEEFDWIGDRLEYRVRDRDGFLVRSSAILTNQYRVPVLSSGGHSSDTRKIHDLSDESLTTAERGLVEPLYEFPCEWQAGKGSKLRWWGFGLCPKTREHVRRCKDELGLDVTYARNGLQIHITKNYMIDLNYHCIPGSFEYIGPYPGPQMIVKAQKFRILTDPDGFEEASIARSKVELYLRVMFPER